MNESTMQSWQILALRSVIAILFGVLAISWPGLTLLWLTALFAAYALLSGAAALIGVMRGRKGDDDHRWLVLLFGLVSIGAGIIAIMHPALTAMLLVLLMGANALVTGVLDIAVALRLRRVIRGEWLMLSTGVVSIVFGILVFLFPDAGALALVWMISLYAVACGVLLAGMAYRVHSIARGRGSTTERRVIPDRRRASVSPAHS